MADSPFPLPPAAFTGASRRTEAGACFDWLRQGWAMFVATPGRWLGLASLFLLLFVTPFFVPGIGPLLAWLLLPFLAAGLQAACRRSVRQGQPRLGDLFAGFARDQGSLLQLGLMHMLAILTLEFLLGLLGGAGPAAGMMGGSLFERLLPSLGLGLALGSLALLGILALAVALPLGMAFCFAPALVLLHGMSATRALQASFFACLHNGLTLLVFGLLLSIMVFFAALPLGLGFLLLIPVLAGALHAAYRDIFVGT